MENHYGSDGACVVLWGGWLGPSPPAERLLWPTFPGVAPLIGAATGWFAAGREHRHQRTLGLSLVVLGADPLWEGDPAATHAHLLAMPVRATVCAGRITHRAG